MAFDELKKLVKQVEKKAKEDIEGGRQFKSKTVFAGPNDVAANLGLKKEVNKVYTPEELEEMRKASLSGQKQIAGQMNDYNNLQDQRKNYKVEDMEALNREFPNAYADLKEGGFRQDPAEMLRLRREQVQANSPKPKIPAISAPLVKEEDSIESVYPKVAKQQQEVNDQVEPQSKPNYEDMYSGSPSDVKSLPKSFYDYDEEPASKFSNLKKKMGR